MKKVKLQDIAVTFGEGALIDAHWRTGRWGLYSFVVHQDSDTSNAFFARRLSTCQPYLSR
jgi:hypothetical protein